MEGFELIMEVEYKDIEYTALFVDSPEKLLKMFLPKHKKIYGHHSTNWYRPTDLNDLEIGKKVVLKIVGRASDKRGDALLVENSKSKNKYPHITISCAENVPPVYSNELLEKASEDGSLELFKELFFIEVTEGYSDNKGNVILSNEVKG